MRIRFYFFILILFLFELGIVLVYLVSKMQAMHLYIAEAIIAFMLIYLGVSYREIIKPTSTIGSGMELLREQGLSSRPSRVGQYKADRIIDIFNRMMEQLRNGCLHMREQNHFLDLLIQTSPMGVVIMTLDGGVPQLDPMAVKMLGVRREKAQNKRLADIDSPLAEELAFTPKDVTSVVRLGDANIYKCTRSSFVDRGSKHPFFLIEHMTNEVMKAEKRAYKKVTRMIAHEVNSTTTGITSTLDTMEQALSTREGVEGICDVIRVCMKRRFSMSRFITRFADVVKIPEPTVVAVRLSELVCMYKRFMEGMYNDRSIILRLEYGPEVGQIRLDASLFEQALVNIMKNIAESIEKSGEAADRQGKIMARTIAPASIEIVDNGPRISKETEAKLFSPFFSTKPNRQGIDLVFVREVLGRHGCTFSLRTYNDGLTHFRILFNP